MNMEIIEFRKILTNDIYDDYYSDGVAWSRIYEYPLVLNAVKKYYQKGYKIHNSAWGFNGPHILFKEKLDELSDNVYHSDILKSDLKNTFIYDITKPPNQTEIEKYDIIINVSTLEEVDFNHLDIFNNLFMQLKKGGIFIATFDLHRKNPSKIKLLLSRSARLQQKRVLQLEKFEKLFEKKIKVNGNPINGKNSHLKKISYKHLNCGLMIIRK